jgi:uncharacterized protein (DUF2336 family)
MSQFQAVVREVEVALQSGMPGRRTEVLRQVTTLFASGAHRLSEEQISLFDDVMGHLIACIENQALVELSSRLAHAPQAPHGVVRKLAFNDALEIAGPVLESSARLSDEDLVEIARTKGQAHQLKIAGRATLNEAVTNVLVEQCDSEVANKVAANKGARFSKAGFAKLAMMADGNSQLAAAIAGRPDIPPHLFRAILARATDTVREGLLNSASPEAREKIRKVLSEISHQIDHKATSEHYASAQQLVSSFSQDTQLTKFNLLKFAQERKFEETVATLAALSAVPIDLVDRLMNDHNRYGIMILCKVMGLHWRVVQNIILTSQRSADAVQSDDDLYGDYNAISPSLAHRLLRFWQTQQ